MADPAGIREMMSRHALATTVVAAVVVLLAAGWIAFQMPEPPPTRPPNPTQDFYTTDDGKTWFRGPPGQPAPFDHDGKPAVKAYVYRCGGTEFVVYLEEFTPDAMRVIEDMEQRVADLATRPTAPGEPGPAAQAGMIRSRTMYQVSMFGREVKRPGDATWTSVGDTQAVAAIQQPKCPHNDRSHTPEPVIP
jgi:hypothetical protein